MNPHLQRGMMLLEQQRFDMAEQELRQALVMSPDDGVSHAVLAVCLAKNEKYDESVREAQAAIGLSPDDAYVHFAHSIVLNERNFYPEAQAAIVEAIRLDPHETDYFAQLAQLHFIQRRWREAKETAEHGLSLDPEDVACTNLRAMALVRLGEGIEAGDTIRSALQHSPEDAYTHANMGWSLIEQGQAEQAMEHFREALRLDPELEWARMGIVEAMKARYFLYRIVLNWFLWMMKLTQRAQWGVILGAYFGYQALRMVAAENPNLALWINPILVVYVAFAVMTWVAGPLFNLVLRLNRFGRLALSDEEIRTSTWVGVCVACALTCLVMHFVTQAVQFLLCALASGLLIPPLSRIYSCSRGWPRATITLATIALAGLAIVLVLSAAAATWLSEEIAPAFMAIINLLTLPFIIAAIAMQFATGALVSVRPRLGTPYERRVWICGGIGLALGALVVAGISALLIASVLLRPPDPELFNIPLRARYTSRDDLAWNAALEVAAAEAALEERGFVDVGQYGLQGLDDVRVQYLLHEEHAIVAELLEHPEFGFVVSLSNVYTDGMVFGLVRGRVDRLAKPPNVVRRYVEGSAGDLYDQMLAQRPGEGIRAVSVSEVIPLAEQFYADEVDFLLQRGGPDKSEMRAMGADQGVELADQTITRLQRIWRRQAAAKVRDFVTDNFIRANEEFSDKDRNRLVCIHDLHDSTAAVKLAVELAGSDLAIRDVDAAEAAAAALAPREAFAAIAAEAARIKKVGQASVPIATDVYFIRE